MITKVLVVDHELKHRRSVSFKRKHLEITLVNSYVNAEKVLKKDSDIDIFISDLLHLQGSKKKGERLHRKEEEEQSKRNSREMLQAMNLALRLSMEAQVKQIILVATYDGEVDVKHTFPKSFEEFHSIHEANRESDEDPTHIPITPYPAHNLHDFLHDFYEGFGSLDVTHGSEISSEPVSFEIWLESVTHTPDYPSKLKGHEPSH